MLETDPVTLVIASLISMAGGWAIRHFFGGSSAPAPAPTPAPVPSPDMAPNRPIVTQVVPMLLTLLHIELTDAEKGFIVASLKHVMDELKIPAPLGHKS